MPAATINLTTLNTSPAITQEQLINTISSLFVSDLGFTLIDSYTDTNIIYRVLSHQYTSALKDTAYLRLSITTNTNVMSLSLFDSWNTTTKNGTNGINTTTTATISIDNGQVFSFRTVNHPEIKGVLITQGNTYYGFHGLIRPANIPTWWDLNNHLFAFMPELGRPSTGSLTVNILANNPTGLFTTTSNAFTNPQHILVNPDLLNTNVNSSSREMLKGIVIANAGGNFGIICKTSNDLALVGGLNLSPGGSLAIIEGVNEYTFLGHSYASPYLAVKSI